MRLHSFSRFLFPSHSKLGDQFHGEDQVPETVLKPEAGDCGLLGKVSPTLPCNRKPLLSGMESERAIEYCLRYHLLLEEVEDDPRIVQARNPDKCYHERSAGFVKCGVFSRLQLIEGVPSCDLYRGIQIARYEHRIALVAGCGASAGEQPPTESVRTVERIRNGYGNAVAWESRVPSLREFPVFRSVSGFLFPAVSLHSIPAFLLQPELNSPAVL